MNHEIVEQELEVLRPDLESSGASQALAQRLLAHCIVQNCDPDDPYVETLSIRYGLYDQLVSQGGIPWEREEPQANWVIKPFPKKVYIYNPEFAQKMKSSSG